MAGKPSVRTDFFMIPCEVRLLWCHLAEKRTTDHENKPLTPDKQYYDVTLLIPKTASDPSQCRNYQFLAQRMQQIVQQQFDGQWPADASREGWPIKDCDQDQSGVTKHPFTKGHWKITPWSNFQPRVVDGGNNDIPRGMDGQYLGFKSGDYGMVSVNAWGWPNGKGISFGIEGVKKTRDGDPVGGAQRSVSQMFGGPEPAPMAPPLPAGGFGGAPAPSYAPAPPTAPQPAPQPQYAPAPTPGYAQPAPTYGAAPTTVGYPSPGQPDPTQPYGAGSPIPGGYPPAAPPAGYPQPGYAAPAPQPSIPGAYPSSPAPMPGYAPAPAPGYAPPGNPVAPPAYGTPQQPPGFAPPIGTR